MKLAYIEMCGFRGFRNSIRIEFADGFTVIDGRNGVGKSTVFDAVEFALTGTIAKYGDAKADGETIADYIWWSGDGPNPVDHYVEVGFQDGHGIIPVRRTQLAGNMSLDVAEVIGRLCDTASMPNLPLSQLCAASIIRDEHIAALSLDLKETERYNLLHDAIGGTDSDAWIERGATLLSLTRKRAQAAEMATKHSSSELTRATKRIDEIRADLVEEEVLAVAAERLRVFSGSTAGVDEIAESARIAIAVQVGRLEELRALQKAWTRMVEVRQRLPELLEALALAKQRLEEAEAKFTHTSSQLQTEHNSDDVAQKARDLMALAALGRRLGQHDDKCPLCRSPQNASDYLNGINVAESYARQLDQDAVELADRERVHSEAQSKLIACQRTLGQCQSELEDAERVIDDFERLRNLAGFQRDVDSDAIREREQAIRTELDIARDDLRIVETVKSNAALQRAVHAEKEAREANLRAEERFGRARRAEQRARALHDAARRAAGESLDRRLERVLPLMAELYRRLRPHPVWGDIEYKIRGDVRRFLKLQVGDELNPQFIFSSGQRRATGLAFLLSVNLSLAWSRWRSILLDDPVQHVDDFRSVHLAELLAQVVTAGRQVVCSVEDAALADLLCRRLPVKGTAQGKRITLGLDANGDLAKHRDDNIAPLYQGALVSSLKGIAG